MEEHSHNQLTKKERKELKRQEKARDAFRRDRSRAVKKWAKRLLVVLFLAGGIGGLVWYDATRSTVPSNEILAIKQDDWVKGNKDAQTTLIEYLDFECEACGAYSPAIERLENEFKDDFRLVVRYFPLPGHKNALPAALAAEAAGQQGKFWEMHDILFKNQKEWGERKVTDSSIFLSYAQKIGLDMERFKNDVNSQLVKDRIERDKQAAKQLNLQGTPSFFLNGEKIQNPRNYEEFKGLIGETIFKSKQNSL